MKKWVIYTVMVSACSLIFSNSSCTSETEACSTPSHFSSYEQADFFIRESLFSVQESLETPESSFVSRGFYFGCDQTAGIFEIIVHDRHDYIYTGVPYFVWQGFQKAESKGTYYNNHIKGQYVRVHMSY